MIQELIEQARPLAEGAKEPKTIYWLEHEEAGTSLCDYCRDCALKVKRALIAGDLTQLEAYDEQTFKYKEHPTHWLNYECTEETIWISGAYSPDSDTLRFCELCEMPLEIGLTGYGTAQEIDHFASLCHAYRDGSMPFDGLGPNAWRELVQALEGMTYIESNWFDGNFRSKWEEKEQMEAYRDALDTVPTLIALETGKARVWLLKDSRYQLALTLSILLITLIVSLAI